MTIHRRMTIAFVILRTALAAFTAFGATATSPPAAERVTEEVLDRIVYHQQGWGELGIDTCTYGSGTEPQRLRIQDQEYDHGLGMHAPGEAVIELDGMFAAFDAEVGVQWQGPNVGSVVFQVFVDGEKRFDSGIMRETDAARAIHIDIHGAFDLRLVMTDAGNGITCDCANWINVRLTPDPNAKATPARKMFDIAPFARVSTWDPNRNDGTAANRTEEFPAADVYLAAEVHPDTDGAYAVPAAEDGRGCIGLEWAERRQIRYMALVFPEGEAVPALDGVQVQCWSGESPWQGGWNTVNSKIEVEDGTWIVRIGYRGNANLRNGTEKVRWVFPAIGKPIRVQRPAAYSRSQIKTGTFRVELEKPMPGAHGRIEIYNGYVLAGKEQALDCAWDLGQAMPFKLAYCESGTWKTDRTVLRVHLPDAAFGIAVEDVLINDAVYVPHAGLFVTRDPAPVSLADYRARIADRGTILDRVRKMPDQTFAQAMEKVHNPVQDLGPMLVSLACDNRKFVAHRDGALTFRVYNAVDEDAGWPGDYPCKLEPRFAGGKAEVASRTLDGGWLPAPVITIAENGITYRQTSAVIPCGDAPLPDAFPGLYEQALCVAEFEIENTDSRPADARLELRLWSDVRTEKLATWQETAQGFVSFANGRVLCAIDLTDAEPLRSTIESDVVIVSGTLPVRTAVKCRTYIPAWPMTIENINQLKVDWRSLLRTYWEGVLAPAMQVALPDPFLENVIRASQVHCLLAARNEDRGKRISAWISSDRYGPLESEANSVIRGMDLMGNAEFARRAHDYFIHRYSPEGFLTTGYTLIGSGWQLWTLAEHYRLTQNREWLGRVAPEVARVCAWICRQREKTMRRDVLGEMPPEFGLMPPGVSADWNRYAYRFYQDGHYYDGLLHAAFALEDIGHPQAPDFLKAADEYRKCIQRGYDLTQQRAPLLPLQNGTWVPAYPGMLYCFGRIEDIIPGEDWNRSWAYDVEVGAHHLALHGILDPNGPRTAWIMDHMEDFWFLHSGMGDYPETKNREDWFSLGGFAKMQPYYARNVEICALRDDVKPFIRSYFNTIPTLLSRENLSFWEHYHNTGGWNKTHETGYFLAQSRLMLVMERGDTLWLAPFVTNNWLKDGMAIEVKNAPTCFGPVSYTIRSYAAQGFIEADIEPPMRNAPAGIVIRLRHPEGKSLQKAEVSGARDVVIDREKECVLMIPEGGPIRLKANY